MERQQELSASGPHEESMKRKKKKDGAWEKEVKK